MFLCKIIVLMSQSVKYWIWSFFYAFLFLAVYGYYFNSSDLEEHLPFVYKLQNPTLYPGDYVTGYLFNIFSVRYYYAHTLFILSHLIPLPQLCFGIMIAALAVFSYYYMNLSYLIFKDELTALITPLTGLIFLNKITVGGNFVFDNMLTCSVFASALCMAALFYFFNEKLKTGMLLCGIATLYQPLIGIQVMMLMLITSFFLHRFNFRELIFGLLSYLVVAAFMLIPLFKRQFADTSSPADYYFYYILYVFRNPHHYIPSFFAAGDYIKNFFLILVTAILFFRKPTPYNRHLMILITCIIAGMFFYYLLFEKANMMVLGKLQWFKTSVWLTLFCGIYIAHFIAQQKFMQSVLPQTFLTYMAIILTVFLILAITHSSLLPFKKLQSRYQVGDYVKSDLTLMHEWIKDSIPEDKIILSFPQDDSFLCEAQHPTPVAWKAIIHEPWFLKKWHHDFVTLYHIQQPVEWIKSDQKQLAEEGYNHFYSKQLMSAYHIAYRLDDITQSKVINHYSVVHQQGNYVLWRTE